MFPVYSYDSIIIESLHYYCSTNQHNDLTEQHEYRVLKGLVIKPLQASRTREYGLCKDQKEDNYHHNDDALNVVVR